MKQIGFTILLFAVAAMACAREYGVNGTVAFEFPPVKRDPQLRVEARTESRSLDDPWSLVQQLWDADTSRPDLWNAYPVGMAMTHEGRGYIVTLHTAFGTLDGGHTWYNMDPFPPPFAGGPFMSLRSPTYISSMAPRPLERTAVNLDSFLVTTFRTDEDSGTVRVFGWDIGTWRPQQTPLTAQPMWLSHIAFVDSSTVCALSDQFGRIVRNDSLGRDSTWDLLPVNLFGGYLAGAAASVQNRIVAVGSSQWVGRLRGQLWLNLPAADSLGDYGVSFSDTLHGFCGGGIISPQPMGWVHRTETGPTGWSDRVLETPFPIRAVIRYTDSVGWAAGGYIDGDDAQGGIYKTTDGGFTWTTELSVNAEVRALTATRITPAYVDVFAAGVFADFHAGVWSTRLYWPDPTYAGPVLVADPDTLSFGIVGVGERDTLSTWIHNLGAAPATLFALNTRGGRFRAANDLIGEVLQPGDSSELRIEFVPDVTGFYRTAVQQENSVDQRCEIVCSGLAPLVTDAQPPTPGNLTLEVWPNPGNAEFALRFALPRAGDASISFFDLNGRLVETMELRGLPAGSQMRSWNASRFASGLYFARIETADAMITRKIMLVK